ncbi:MAG: alpha/beta hydrolase [Lachnospiraceae bacterium]|nr:alpha/beta hydrolase [Lachnospiraceae bacterium]
MKIEKQNFTCKRDGLTIRGIQYYPADFNESKSYPAVILSHGFTGNYMDSAYFGEEFAKMGYAAFAFSFCGGGKHTKDACFQSEGATTDMTIWTEVDDLLTVKDYVKSLPYVNDKELILIGFSQGGFVSGLTAAKCGEEIKKLIMVFPALCIPDHARRGCLGGSAYDPCHVPETIDCGVTMLGKRFHETVVDMDPYLELAAYQGEVLIIHGLDDKVVNYSYSVRAKENYQEGQCHLQLVRNMDHGLDAGQQESAFASMRQFLNGRKEILTIRVVITHVETVTKADTQIKNIFFNGYCDTKYFQGTVLPGGCDERKYDASGQEKVRAEYTLEGLDIQGEKCSIHIVNQWGGEEWKPVAETDSKALTWLNHADLTAVLEGGDGGPTVRIFADSSLL